MNNPSPLPPLSSFSPPPKGRSNVRIAVIVIIALHAVFFGGLLSQGCRQKATDLAGNQATTNAPLDLGPLTNQPFGDLTNTVATTPSAPVTPAPTSTPSNWAQPTQPVVTAPQTPQPTAPAPTPVVATLPATSGPTEYLVVRGDTPASIAKKHGVSTEALLKANPGLQPRKLQIKQKLTIPAAMPSAPSTAGAATASEPGPAPDGSQVHLVKGGETLTKIAKQHGVTVKAIRAANGLKTDRIHVNQKLKVPPGQATPAATTTAALTPGTAPTTTAGLR